MRFVIVTGMSGAGKSTALKIWKMRSISACVNTFPIPLVEKFARLALEGIRGDQQGGCGWM